MRFRETVAGWLTRAADALSGRREAPASLEATRHALRGLVEALAVVEALCEAAGERLGALESEERRWADRAATQLPEGLEGHAADALNQTMRERDAVRRLFGRLVEDLEESMAVTLAATLRFEQLAELAQRTGHRRPAPAPHVDEALRRAAREYVAQELDLGEVLSVEAEGADFRERVFERLEARGGLH